MTIPPRNSRFRGFLVANFMKFLKQPTWKESRLSHKRLWIISKVFILIKTYTYIQIKNTDKKVCIFFIIMHCIIKIIYIFAEPLQWCGGKTI